MACFADKYGKGLMKCRSKVFESTKNELKSKVICWEQRGGDLSCFVCFPAAAAATCYMFSLQYVTLMNIHVNIVVTKCSMLSNERVTCSLCRLLHL